MRTLALNVSAQVVLDGNGDGIASVGPGAPGHVWYPTQVSINMTGNIPDAGNGNISQVIVYAGNDTSSLSVADSTYNVNTNSTQNLGGIAIYPGQSVSAQWIFGNPGAVATINVTGTRTVP